MKFIKIFLHKKTATQANSVEGCFLTGICVGFRCRWHFSAASLQQMRLSNCCCHNR